MAEKAKEVAIEEADRIKSLAQDVARSGAYLYPLRVWIATPRTKSERTLIFNGEFRAFSISCPIDHCGTLFQGKPETWVETS